MFHTREMSVFDWWIVIVLMMIPIVNIILFLYILFSSSVNPSLKNLQLALILPVLFIAIWWMINGVPFTRLNGAF